MDLTLLSVFVIVWTTITAGKLPDCPRQCQCDRGTSGDFEVHCPKNSDTTLQTKFMAGKYLRIQCTRTTHVSDLRMLRGLKVGPVRYVLYTFCPLPESLSEYMDSLNVTGVQTLSVQYSNLTTTLNKEQFKSFSNISRLELVADGLTQIPEDFFENMRNLTSLDLRENNLELPLKLLNNIPNLRHLELGKNSMKNLQPGVFKNLTQLKLLNLWGNSLLNLTKHVFEDIKKLESLDLQRNELTTLDADVFSHLENLRNLSLTANNFSSLPDGLFSSITKLEVLVMSGNRQRLSVPPGLLANLTQLKDVSLNHNNISVLPSDLFRGCASLVTVRLQNNALTTIPEDLFEDTVNLKTLDLSSNKLQTLPSNVFSSLAKLRVLKLANNQLTNIATATLRGLAALEELDLERNALRKIDTRAFANTRNIKKLKLSHNFLTFNDASDVNGYMAQDVFGSQSPLHYCINLEELRLVNNSLREIFSDWRLLMNRLSKLDLRHNNITFIEPSDLQFLSDELVIDLSNNMITDIDLRGLELVVRTETSHPNDDSKHHVKVILKNNPLRCDCRVYNLLKYIERKLQPIIYKFIELNADDFVCSSPEEVSGFSLSNLKSETITCELTSGDLGKEECPKPCKCWGRPDDRALIVECIEVGLRAAPEYLPLTDAWNHTEIHLEKNWLRALPRVTLAGYERVTKIFASHNNISRIEPENIPAKLQELDLAYNNLTHIDVSTLNFLTNGSNLQGINLYSNPWQCDCDARDLLNFIQARFKQVALLPNTTCSDGRKLSQLSADDLCPTNVNFIVAVSSSIAVLGIIIGALAAMYYRYQQQIKVWLYARNLCLWFVTEQELDRDKHYDAFISYSHKDEDFVVQNLVPGLETGPSPFKLCLHFRDWVAGDWIPNQIARSVEDSRRTMVILSPNFLESVWGRMEFRAAHSQALKEGRARVIVVLYGDVGPIDGLDPELKAYLSMNTYVKWGDPWFWNKLRYALPHPPQMMKRSGIIDKPPELRVKTEIEDKLELMEPVTPSATTPPASTIIDPMINGHIFTSNTNGHAKLVKDTNENSNGYLKSI